jgi:hypothetical protein
MKAFDPRFRQNPLPFFLLFFAVNVLVAYTVLPTALKVLLAALALGLPFAQAWRAPPAAADETPAYGREIFVSPGLWFGAPVLVLAAFLRFYRLEGLFRWPTLDEGWNGILALDLSRHWTWRFFYTFGQAPPLPVWCSALLFKIGAPPFLCLWLPSACVSLLTAGAGYGAARSFFPRSFALICGGLLAFSYWPLFLGRFCHQGVWLPLWVCLCLWALGTALRAFRSGPGKGPSLALGLCLGLGSFTFTPWPLVVLFFSVLFLTRIRKIRPDQWKVSAAFWMFGLLASLAPFLLAAAKEGYGRHILSLSPWGGWFHWKEGALNVLRYCTVLFWGPFEASPAYTPAEGGFLNPLLGAAFGLGALELLRFRKRPLEAWALLAFPVFLLPGWLSLNLEGFRIVQVLPLLLFITAVGVQTLLASLPGGRRLFYLCFLLLLTAAWDFSMLCLPYLNPESNPRDFGRPLKSLERYRAYRELDSLQKREGPGWVLADFAPGSLNDPTLSLMTLPFNAAMNPSLEGSPIRWAALFVSADYVPFLERDFPESRWDPVGRGLSLENGGDALGLFKPTPRNLPRLMRWIRAYRYFQAADLRRFVTGTDETLPAIAVLDRGYPEVRGDPFLESCFWDKRAAYEYARLDFAEHLRCARMALERGYPAAHLYFNLGLLYLKEGLNGEAEKAFEGALRAPADQTAAAWILSRFPPPSPSPSSR